MQDSLVAVSSSNTGDLDKSLVVSRLNQIKEMENYKWVYSHKVHYLNIPISFDIETSSFMDGIAKKAIMYIWTCNIMVQHLLEELGNNSLTYVIV